MPDPAPTGHAPKQCSSCKASIVWAQLIDEAGHRVTNDDTGRPKSIPVDFEPVANGNVQLFDRGGAVVARVLGRDEAEQLREKARILSADPRLRLNHFVTCPNREQHRKAR